MAGSYRRWVRVSVIGSLLLTAACGGEVGGSAQPPENAATTTSSESSGPRTTSRGPTTTRGSSTGADPAADIEGIVVVDYQFRDHAKTGQRVAYDRSPPFGGAHDAIWADCNGIVYTKPVRNENMVHALEHGTVWIAYNPDRISGGELDKLKDKVDLKPYMMLSPYPGLDKPISLQSWGHQLKVDDAGDRRIDAFITALRANRLTTPEPGARCDTADPSQFDPDDPPPFDPSPPGPDAAPVTPR